jgi:galactonate dehydratase
LLSLAGKTMQLDDISPRQFRRDFVWSKQVDHSEMEYSCAVSAIEMALWDLLGKFLNSPVYRLLGGPLMVNIPLYANTWIDGDLDLGRLVQRCTNLVEQGYRAIKIYPLKFGNAQDCGECIKVVRQTVGDNIDIMLDLSAINNPSLALDCARKVTPYRPYWFEEPHPGEDLETLARIRRQAGLRIVTGEKQVGKEHYLKALNLQAADILNPDIAGCGGILEILEIGAMAETHSVTVSPHCWNSMTLALAAMLQVCAVMPNAEFAETFPTYFPFGEIFCRTNFIVAEGVARLGSSSGLGIEIDRSALISVADVHSTL